MAKKKTWKENTGLKVGDIAYCNGTIQYNHRKYQLDELVKIKVIKSNACTCIINELNGKENVEVSILKQYLTKPKSENNENEQIETVSEVEQEGLIAESNNDSKIKNENTKILDLDKNIEQSNDIKDSNTDDLNNNLSDNKEEINSEETIEENDLDKSIEKTNDEPLLDNISTKLEETVDEILSNEIFIPNVGFRNFTINSELHKLIEEAATYPNHKVFVDETRKKRTFHGLQIKDLKEMYLHVPTNNNPFKPNLCYKLICNIDYLLVKEINPFINNNIKNVELEIYINQDTLNLDKYEFLTVSKNDCKKVIDLNLTKLQEADIEIYGQKCVRYYEELSKEVL